MLVFPVTSYPWRPFLVAVIGVAVVPLLVVGTALVAAEAIPGWLFIFTLAVALGFMLSVLLALTALLLYVATRNEITSRKGTIHLKGGAFHERLQLDAITTARIVDIGQDRSLRPLKRENGLSLPGFQVGWFTLQNGAWTFVLRSGRKRAVFIETTQGFSALLAVKDPERLLAHIEDAQQGAMK